LGIEIGTQPGETLAARVADIEAIFADCRTRLPDFSAEIEVKVERDPFRASGHEALLASADRAAVRTIGRPHEQIGVNAWMDSPIMQNVGIPTISIGAQGGNFHSPDEWVSLPECLTLVGIVRETARDFCA
jgi:acetylornithine deacetylase